MAQGRYLIVQEDGNEGLTEEFDVSGSTQANMILRNKLASMQDSTVVSVDLISSVDEIETDIVDNDLLGKIKAVKAAGKSFVRVTFQDDKFIIIS